MFEKIVSQYRKYFPSTLRRATAWQCLIRFPNLLLETIIFWEPSCQSVNPTCEEKKWPPDVSALSLKSARGKEDGKEASGAAMFLGPSMHVQTFYPRKAKLFL